MVAWTIVPENSESLSADLHPRQYAAADESQPGERVEAQSTDDHRADEQQGKIES